MSQHAGAEPGPRGLERRSVGRCGLAAGAVAVLMLAGCASAAPSRPATGASWPASASSSATSGGSQSASPIVTASPAAGAEQPTRPRAGALTATITILGAQDGMLPGGPPMHFTVTVTNHSARAYANILPLVSVSHCTCTASAFFPAGTIQVREGTSRAWQAMPFDVEDFGTDFLRADEPGRIQSLGPDGVATFEYRMALKPVTAEQSAQMVPGTGHIDVTLLQLPGRRQFGPAPTASVTVHVMPGAFRA